MNTKVNEGKLISGKEALIALANGQDVEYKSINGWSHAKHLHAYEFLGVYPKFRLKPRTISVNGIEVPAPFLPEEGELFYHVSPGYMNGYGASMHSDGNVDTWQQFGAWRTEDEVKQVVAALRQVFGGSHDN